MANRGVKGHRNHQNRLYSIKTRFWRKTQGLQAINLVSDLLRMADMSRQRMVDMDHKMTSGRQNSTKIAPSVEQLERWFYEQDMGTWSTSRRHQAGEVSWQMDNQKVPEMPKIVCWAMKPRFWQKQGVRSHNHHPTIQTGSNSQGDNENQNSWQMDIQKAAKITKIACVVVRGDSRLKQSNRYRNWQPSIRSCSEGIGQHTQKVSGHLEVQKTPKMSKIVYEHSFGYCN